MRRRRWEKGGIKCGEGGGGGNGSKIGKEEVGEEKNIHKKDRGGGIRVK
jgi:hypothetical protein